MFQVAEAPPSVAAAAVEAPAPGQPVFYAGSYYYPAGPTVFFDPYVMVRTGTFQGVPLYSDTTLEPYSVVYVPIGGNVMRPYEKRRAGALAGTVGSRTPSFPVQRDVDLSAATAVTGLMFPPQNGAEPEMVSEQSPTAVGTAGAAVPKIRRIEPSVTETIAGDRVRPTRMESIPQPQTNGGIWLEYAGAKWRADGGAVQYLPERFIEVGDYHGFPVFRNRTEKIEAIYIPSVKGGPLSRYQRP